MLDGITVAVHWSDGDTFRVKGARHPARVSGYNTLESYGPVHRWGSWDPHELEDLALGATELVASKTRTCRSLGKVDAYGRDLVSCPDAAAALIDAGLAMVFAMEADVPDAALLVRQKAAQEKAVGIWAKGVPTNIVTSVHSADETKDGVPLGSRAGNRTVDTRTGMTAVHQHG